MLSDRSSKALLVLPLLVMPSMLHAAEAWRVVSRQEPSGSVADPWKPIAVERKALLAAHEELQRGPVPLQSLLRTGSFVLSATEIVRPGDEQGKFDATLSMEPRTPAPGAKPDQLDVAVTVITPSEDDHPAIYRIMLEFSLELLPTDLAVDASATRIGRLVVAFSDTTLRMCALQSNLDFEHTPALATKLAGQAGVETGASCSWEPGQVTWTPTMLNAAGNRWSNRILQPTRLEAADRCEGELELFESRIIKEFKRLVDSTGPSPREGR